MSATPIVIPKQLRENKWVSTTWLEQLPATIADLAQEWELSLGDPFEDEASCSWVAPCIRADGSPAVFKIGWPHMEAEDEIEGLRFWDGNPTAYLLEASAKHNAMLLERCEPGTVLRTRPEEQQYEIIAQLLRRLWRMPPEPHAFRPLSEMIEFWSTSALKRAEQRPDAGLIKEGVGVYQQLLDSTVDPVLLATDLHAGNVLRAQRKPWLVIDPKPFIGDRAYDATQHLLNCWQRLQTAPFATIDRFANLLNIDGERIRLWLFARIVIEEWGENAESQNLARHLAP